MSASSGNGSCILYSLVALSAASGLSGFTHALTGSRAGTILTDGTVTFLVRNIAAIFTICILNVPAILCGAFFVLRFILRAVLLRAILSVTVLDLIVVIGLLGSALCNLLVGCSNTYWQILVLWGLNGVAQSMLWTPMVRLIAVWFDSKKRSVVSFWMCVCFIIGHLLAWAVSGLMAARFSWRTSFFAPAAVLVFATSVALYTLRDRTKEHSDDKAHVPPMPIREMLFGTGLWLIFLGCIATGFARDGVMTWAPTLIGALFSSQNASSGVIISLIIPLLNLMGLLLGQFLLRRSNGNLRPTICRLLIAAAICTLLLAVFHALPAFLFTLLLGILCGLMYSVSNMQNVILPLEYADTGRVSLIAGIADSMIYIGTSLVSVISGLLMQSVGQSAVYISWGIAAMISCTLTMLAGRTAKQ